MRRQRMNKEQFLDKLFSSHPEYKDIYDFSEFDFKNLTTKAKVICKKHGTFKMQNPRHMIVENVTPCKECSKENNSKIFNTESYIEMVYNKNPEFKELFDYSKTNYKGPNCKSTIICKKHNNEFTQELTEHLYKGSYNCPECRREKRGVSLDKEKYLETLFEKYPELKENYDYENFEFKKEFSSRRRDISSKVLCKKHNIEFDQSLYNHFYNGSVSCPECKNEIFKENGSKSFDRKMERKKWKEKALAIHGDHYYYRHSIYKGQEKPIKIKCKKHNLIFKINQARYHIQEGSDRGQCPECNHEKYYKTPEDLVKIAVSGFTKDIGGLTKNPFYKQRFMMKNEVYKTYKRFYDNEERMKFFRLMSKYAFGNKFDYSLLDVNNFDKIRTKVKLKCRKHNNVFEITTKGHLNSLHGGCDKCFANTASQVEKEFKKSLKEFDLRISSNNRKIIKNEETNRYQEIDILLPSLNLGIEVNGINWHSSITKKEMNNLKYHMINKMLRAEKLGYKFLGFYDDELVHKHELCVKEVTRFMEGSYSIPNYNKKNLSIEETSKKIFKKKYEKESLNFFIDDSNKYYNILYKGQIIGGFSLNNKDECYNYFNIKNIDDDINLITESFPNIKFIIKYDSYDKYKFDRIGLTKLKRIEPDFCNFVRDEKSPIKGWKRIKEKELNNIIFDYGKAVFCV